MINDVLIVGAGGMGRETYWYLQAVIAQQPGRYKVKGFLDDNAAALDAFNIPSAVVGTVAGYAPAEGELLVCAIGDPAVKARICASLKERGARFLSVIHPSAVICPSAVIGEGALIAPFAVVSADARLGDFVLLNCFASCGHDTRIGNYCSLSSHCDITGAVELGQRVFVGSHASIIPGRKIGDDAYIGAGSVVISHQAAGRRTFGVPAKKII